MAWFLGQLESGTWYSTYFSRLVAAEQDKNQKTDIYHNIFEYFKGIAFAHVSILHLAVQLL